MKIKPLIMILTIVCLALANGSPTYASYDLMGREDAGNRMLALGVIKGIDGALALNESITRAELVTIIVRAFGQESTAKLLAGARSFPDVQGHWASGYIAIAKNMIEKNGHTLGLPNGTFNPNGKITAAEALTLMMKFLGVKPDTTKAWPDDYIQGAVNAGLITADDAAILGSIKNTAADRGLVFYFADQAFGKYKLANGKTVYTTYVDTEAPKLQVNPLGIAETTETKITVTGTVTGANEVSVNENAAVITNGKLTATASLKIGLNRLIVTARDLAGNTTTTELVIERKPGKPGEPVKITVPGTITVPAGGSADIDAKVTDADGNPLTDAEISGTSDAGTFAKGKFTAVTKAGTGKLTLSSGSLTKSVDVTVTSAALAKLSSDKSSVKVGDKALITGIDIYGNIVAGIALSSDNADLSIDQTTGTITASKIGVYTITGKAGSSAANLKMSVYGAPDRVVIDQPDTSGWLTGESHTITAKVVDINGSLVTDYNGGIIWITSPGSSISGTTITDGIVRAAFLANSSGSHTVRAALTVGTGAVTLSVVSPPPPEPSIPPATAPVFTESPSSTVINHEGDSLSDAAGSDFAPITVSATSNRPITYSVTGLPPGLTINPSTGKISGTIGDVSAGEHSFNVTVTATNSASQSASVSFVWSVTDPTSY